MPYDFNEINRRAKLDPLELIGECDESYNRHVREAADTIAGAVKTAHIVLLSGPSGSGKTTTAKKIEEELNRRGIVTYTVSMDNYFHTVDLSSHPRGADGVVDFESPECLDIKLLTEHIQALSEGREVLLPKFDFSKQARDESRSTPLRLGDNEVAIFEGIHALNDLITGEIGNRATKMYISARSDIYRDGAVFYKGTWTRLTRRLIRDLKFRGAPASFTLSLWENVRLGEKKYISPFKNKSDILFDTTLPYELPVLRSFALEPLSEVPDPCGRREELLKIGPRLAQFTPIDEKLVAPDSMLREFIGGGTYNY
jgi:uridine kinase